MEKGEEIERWRRKRTGALRGRREKFVSSLIHFHWDINAAFWLSESMLEFNLVFNWDKLSTKAHTEENK